MGEISVFCMLSKKIQLEEIISVARTEGEIIGVKMEYVISGITCQNHLRLLFQNLLPQCIIIKPTIIIHTIGMNFEKLVDYVLRVRMGEMPAC